MKTLDELLTKESLIEWLKTKPSDQVYNYLNEPRCVLSSFFDENGHPELMAGFSTAYQMLPDKPTEAWIPLPEGWNTAARDGTRTYGELLKRIEAL